jgi:hypothetical protein
MRSGEVRRNEARRGISRLALAALAVLTILALVLPEVGAGGQKSNLKKTLFWEASEVPPAWKPVPDNTPFWPWAGEGSVRNGFPSMVWWWVKFIGQSLPPDQILPKSEGYEINHPRLRDYRQALSGVSWLSGPLFFAGPGGNETVRERFLVMEFQTIEGARDFVAIVRRLYEQTGTGRDQEKQKNISLLEESLQRKRQEVGTLQERTTCGRGCGQIRSPETGGYWGWDQRPVALGDEGVLFLSTFTHSIWEVLATCQDRRWAKVNSVNKVGDYICLKDGWGLIRKNNFVLACWFQLDAAYDRSWDTQSNCGDVLIPPKAPPTATIQDLIVRAYERMALGAGMPPNIPKDPFGPDKKAAGPLAAAMGALR